jgi:nitrate reductase delta subunit
MIRTLKVRSALLTYPDAELQTAAPDLAAALRAEGLLDAAHIAALAPLLGELAQNDLFDLQERFVLLFDRSRTLSLNLFEHVHGESRARGGAMVDLLETYRAGGFEPVGPELPDHLPDSAHRPPLGHARGRGAHLRRPRRAPGAPRRQPLCPGLPRARGTGR